VCKIGLTWTSLINYGKYYLAVDLVLDGGALGDLHVDAHLLVHRPAGGLRDRPGYRPAKHTKVRVAIYLRLAIMAGKKTKAKGTIGKVHSWASALR